MPNLLTIFLATRNNIVIQINPDRLLTNLNTLRGFGATGTGVVRTAFSKSDMESRRWLVDQMSTAGMHASIDGAGNVIGQAPNCDQALLIGSHSDTQPTGGWLDGAMGVIYGLEIATAYQESGLDSGPGIDVVSWMDEEGAYFSCLGSTSFAGAFTDQQFQNVTTVQGGRLRDVLTDVGLAHTPRVTNDTGRYLGYLEAHIEQGPYLDSTDKHIGVVTAIVGIRDFTITCYGTQNHAGTTPMNLRKDAGLAAIHIAHDLDELLAGTARDSTVWTFGNMTFNPGAISIISGQASLALQVRDADEAILDSMTSVVHEFVGNRNRTSNVRVTCQESEDWVAAVSMNAQMQKHISDAAQKLAPGKWMMMQSGAGHDAQVIAPIIPSGMLFVPSIDGVSHDFNEDTSPDHIILGCQVLAAAADVVLKL